MFRFASFSLLMYSTISLAVPSAFTSKCGALPIGERTSSTLLRDHENCQTVWVLPPTLGTAEMSGYLPSGNLNFCEEVKTIQKTSHSLTMRMAAISDEIENLSPTYAERQADVSKAKSFASSFKNLPEVQMIVRATEAVSKLDKEIVGIYKKLETCTSDCSKLYELLDETKDQKEAAKDRLYELEDKHADIMSDMRDAEAKFEAAEYALKGVHEEITARELKIITLRATLQSWLQFYAKLEGGTAFLDYDTKWTQNTAALNAKYQRRLEFKQVATRGVRITANFVGSNDKETYLSSMPAILDYAIGGVKFTPWGEQGAIEQSAFPSRMAGSVRLSLMGACPIYYKNFLDSDTLLADPDKSTKHMPFAINATYEYQAAFKFDVTARYNLYAIYRKMVEEKNAGGFFSSESFRKMTDDQSSGDNFEITWDDESDAYSPEQRDQIEKTIKAELMARVLQNMATPVFTKEHPVEASAPTNTTHGAIVFADGLSETCGYFSIGCQAGAWLLRGFDAWFGSDTARSKFEANHNHIAQERWSRSEAKWRSAATSFASNK